jgi:hypothetical protein
MPLWQKPAIIRQINATYTKVFKFGADVNIDGVARHLHLAGNVTLNFHHRN